MSFTHRTTYLTIFGINTALHYAKIVAAIMNVKAAIHTMWPLNIWRKVCPLIVRFLLVRQQTLDQGKLVRHHQLILTCKTSIQHIKCHNLSNKPCRWYHQDFEIASTIWQRCLNIKTRLIQELWLNIIHSSQTQLLLTIILHFFELKSICWTSVLTQSILTAKTLPEWQRKKLVLKTILEILHT